MFSFFKKKAQPVIYFSGLPPKERIDRFILELIKPVLDRHQFDLKKTDYSFARDVGGFKQLVHFKRSVHNSKDQNARFEILLSLFDLEYENWHQTFYQTKPATSELWGKGVGQLEGWNTKWMNNSWYDIATTDNNEVIEYITQNMETVALPLLTQLSSRKNALALLRKTSFRRCAMLFDYCVMRKDKKTAALMLSDFEDYLGGHHQNQYSHERKLYEVRKQVYKEWSW